MLRPLNRNIVYHRKFNTLKLMTNRHILFMLLAISSMMIACSKDKNTGNPTQNSTDDCKNEAIDRGIVFYENETKLLYGGENDGWHFRINNLNLDECRFSSGLGRESFHALIEPEYIPVQEETYDYRENERTIVVFSDDGPMAYPISLARSHEVINDVIDDKPVAIVYCVLANFFRVYSRKICDTVFTFALSGYTYNDPNIWDGRDGFVWWDRETESLWWPLIDKAVSGTMKGADLQIFPRGEWAEMYWKDVLEKYPDAMVLKRNQTMEPPEGWQQFEENPCGD